MPRGPGVGRISKRIDGGLKGVKGLGGLIRFL